MVAPDDSNFDPAQHLSFRDITVDSLTCPSCLSVNIKQSKTDPFRVGVSVIPYRGLISRGQIFVDRIVKTFRGYIFEDKHHFTR